MKTRKLAYLLFVICALLLSASKQRQSTPLIWAGWVTQYEDSDPYVTEIKDDFGITLSWTRALAGRYLITSSANTFVEFHTIVNAAFEQPMGGIAQSYSFDYLTPTHMGFKTFNAGGGDDWNVFVEIVVYP